MKNNKMIFAIAGIAIAIAIILIIFLLIFPTQCSKQNILTTETETTVTGQVQQETVSKESKQETATETKSEATTAKETTTTTAAKTTAAETTAKETTTATATETTAAPTVAPTVKLEIYEGPVYLPADDIYYYRVKAVVTGTPTPTITFSKDDSGGAWGTDKVQINLRSGQSYTLIAVAKSPAGVASDSISLVIAELLTPEPTGSVSNFITTVHPSAIGYIVYPTGINAASAIIGDSISNASVRGYFTFDISGLVGKNIVSVNLEIKTFRTLDDPLTTFLGRIEVDMIENYLPLGTEDWWPSGVIYSDNFNHDEEPLSVSNDLFKNAIQQRVDEGKNAYFWIWYYDPEKSDGDFRGDGREFTKDTITLKIKYTD
jgi:hypothetical protein